MLPDTNIERLAEREDRGSRLGGSYMRFYQRTRRLWGCSRKGDTNVNSPPFQQRRRFDNTDCAKPPFRGRRRRYRRGARPSVYETSVFTRRLQHCSIHMAVTLFELVSCVATAPSIKASHTLACPIHTAKASFRLCGSCLGNTRKSIK